MPPKALLLTSQPSLRNVVSRAWRAATSITPYQTSCFKPNKNWTLRSIDHGARPYSAKTKPTVSAVLKNIKDHTAENIVSIFHSRSNNPYHNLAIENYLLRNSHAQSKILLFYTNRPCVVIGRNQNPWLECNIAKIQEGLPWNAADWDDGVLDNDRHVIAEERDGYNVSLDLVRRRSGGGTVIHDVGNLNFSFIVPNDKDFTRDKHAELIVRALMAPMTVTRFRDHVLYDNVHVNQRHDIVMTCANVDGGNTQKEFKVSGSAFKLTRGRALHHGTILHSSPNINRQVFVAGDEGGQVAASVFSALLSSPAKPFLEAKGVGSVRSPVHNLFDVTDQVQRREVVRSLRKEIGQLFMDVNGMGDISVEEVGDEDCAVDMNGEIYRDAQELMTDDWRFCQTPTFEYRSEDAGGALKMRFQVKHGLIQNASLEHVELDAEQQLKFAGLEGKKLHEIQSWTSCLPPHAGFRHAKACAHLETVFPKIQPAGAAREGGAESTIIQEADLSGSNQDGIAVKRKAPGGRIELERGGENVVVER